MTGVIISPSPAPTPSASPAQPDEPPMVLRVLGPDGALVQDADVTVFIRLFAGLRTRAGTAARRDDGAWALSRQAQPELRDIAIDPPMHRVVRVAAPGLGVREIAFETGPHDVRFDEPARLVVRLVGLPDGPFHACLRREPEPWQNLQHVGVPARERIDFGGRQPGRHDVVVFLRSDAPVSSQFWPVCVAALEVESGEHEEVVEIGPLHRLVVRFDGASPGDWVTLERHPRRFDRAAKAA